MPQTEADNLRHWSDLSRTDPNFTKPFTRSGGFRGTDINPTWRIMRMTERFGPCGIGWGTTKPEYSIERAGEEIAVYCTVGIWYVDNGVRSEPVWGVGGDIAAKKRSDGKLAVDDEAYKKAYTDALGNAMKSLGVSADVFLKLFDDSKYREAVSREFEGERRQKQEATSPPQSQPQPAAAEPAKPDAAPLTLQLGEGEMETFPSTKRGALDLLNRLEELVTRDRWYWEANKATAGRLGQSPLLADQVKRISETNLRMAG